MINTLRPRQDCRHFTDDIFYCIFLNKNVCISIQISLKFVLKGPVDDTSALDQLVFWYQTGDKPLPESMMAQFIDAYVHHSTSMN